MPKNAEADFLNEVMGFDTNNLSIFDETPKAEANPRIYKTNPVKLSKSEDGHYHAKIRILYNPFNIRESVVKSVKYNMRDTDGFFQADSKLAINDKKCPIFTAWKKLHFAKTADGKPDTVKDEWSKEKFDKSETKWVLVQIIEDENQPEEVGKFKAWKLPFTIWEKMEAKMHPTSDKKTPVALMDYLFGPALELDVAPGEDDPKHPERKEREISYSLCEFETDPTPLMTLEAEPLFDEEQLEFIEEYFAAKSKTSKENIAKAKTPKAKKEIADAQEYLKENQETLKELYKIALSYMKENSFDILDECGYHEWDAALTARVNSWLDKVSKMIDPETGATDAEEPSTTKKTSKKASKKNEEDESDPFQDVVDENSESEDEEDYEDNFEDEDGEGDLPF